MNHDSLAAGTLIVLYSDSAYYKDIYYNIIKTELIYLSTIASVDDEKKASDNFREEVIKS